MPNNQISLPVETATIKRIRRLKQLIEEERQRQADPYADLGEKGTGERIRAPVDPFAAPPRDPNDPFGIQARQREAEARGTSLFQEREPITGFEALGHLGRAGPATAAEFLPGETGREFRELRGQVGPLEAFRRPAEEGGVKFPSVEVPEFIRDAIAVAISTTPGIPKLSEGKVREVIKGMTPEQLGIKGALEAFAQPDILIPGAISGVKVTSRLGGAVSKLSKEAIETVVENALPRVRVALAEELGAVGPGARAAKPALVAKAARTRPRIADIPVGPQGRVASGGRPRQKIIDEAVIEPAAEVAGGFRGQHRPMTVENGAARLHDLTPSFGEDIYGVNARRFFGTGDDVMDNATLNILKRVRGKPDSEITVFRAIPKDAPDVPLSSGDWVTVNRSYAAQHGEAALRGDYRVIQQKVRVRDLTTNADSFHEMGYYPRVGEPVPVKVTQAALAKPPTAQSISPVAREAVVPPPASTTGGTGGGGGELGRVQDMLQPKGKPPPDWDDLGLKAQEYLNDSYYGVRRLQTRVQRTTPIVPGSQQDVITGITRAPGAPNAGLTRYENAIAEMKRLAPGANVTDINTVVFAEHGKEVLLAKGPKRVLPGGVNTVEGLENALRDLEARLGTEQYQKVRQAAEVLKRTYATERQRLVDSGLISQKLADALAEEYPWYNPLRYLDYAEEQAAAGKIVRPISVTSSGLKRLSEVGSERAIQDPLSALSGELIRNEVRIQKNDLAHGIIDIGLKEKGLGITKRKITVPVAEAEGRTIFRPQRGEIPGTISFMDKGVRQVYDVPEWMYRETAVLNQTIRNPVSSFIGSLNGVSRAAFTTFSPAFTMANIANDMLPALVRGGVYPTSTARRFLASFRSLESDQLMQAYRLSGGYQGRFYGREAAQIAQEAGATGGTVIGKNFNWKKAIRDVIPTLGEKGEQAPRQASFLKSLNKNLPKWRTMTPEQIAATPEARKAAADAVEATINFNRGGYFVRAANPFAIFINAGMEGTKLPYRALRESARARWTLAGLSGGVAGLTMYNMSYPEYFDVPNRVRWGSVMIMLPSTKKNIDGTPVPKYLTIIPNTREWATFFASITYGLEKTMKDSPQDAGQFAFTMFPQVSPLGNIPSPQILLEASQQLANYDFYHGRPIVSQSMQNLPTTEQTGPYVSSTVEKLSKAAGLSPIRVDHAIRSIFGGAGSAALSITDLVAGATNTMGRELKTKYDAMPESQRVKWVGDLSNAERSALKAAVAHPDRQIPVLGGILNRFYKERGGQLEQNEWERLDRALSELQKSLSRLPDINRLLITVGAVGDSIDGNALTIAQRAQYQEIAGRLIIERVQVLQALPKYEGESDESKEKAIRDTMDDAREAARNEVLRMIREGGQPTERTPRPIGTPSATSEPPAQPSEIQRIPRGTRPTLVGAQ